MLSLTLPLHEHKSCSIALPLFKDWVLPFGRLLRQCCDCVCLRPIMIGASAMYSTNADAFLATGSFDKELRVISNSSPDREHVDAICFFVCQACSCLCRRQTTCPLARMRKVEEGQATVTCLQLFIFLLGIPSSVSHVCCPITGTSSWSLERRRRPASSGREDAMPCYKRLSHGATALVHFERMACQTV